MRRFPLTLIFPLLLTFLFVSPAAGFLWDTTTLVTIDGTTHTTEDFKRWWHYFNDADMALPKTPELYIDWLLLAREGKRMMLDEDPSFQHRTEVFLKVRSLLMLQREEIIDKITIADDELRTRYEKLYTPRWLLERLQFATAEAAQTAWQELQDGTVTIDELEARPREQGGPTAHREDWRRPVGIDAEWAAIFGKLAVGEATEPIKDLDDFVFYFLKEKKDGDPEDFDYLRKRISEKIFQERKEELTAALLSRLREKFNLQVDEKRLADLDLDAPDGTFGEAPIITSSRENFSEKDFMAILRKDEEVRQPGRHGRTAEADNIKNRVVNGIIGQNLTNWEALDRHYEEQEPFKWEYQFNVRHRLTNAVQARLFAAKVTVSDEEIKNYYMENISRYTQPEMVDLVLIDDTAGDVDRVWGEVAAGKDFFKAVKEITEQSTTAETLPLIHLEPSVQEIVAKLTTGETSRPFTNEGHRFLLHLTERTPAVPVPLEKVSQTIRSSLMAKKIAQKRKEYLDLLKSRSAIKVNESNWQAIQKELGGNT
jgi:parvulin-like peptidyl-prolyl isomerase